MGCNTSKDSVPQTEGEHKENQGGTGETNEDKNIENTNEGEENHVNESSDTKSISAKTITLRSNGTAKSVEEPEQESKSKSPEPDKSTPNQTKEGTKDPAGKPGGEGLQDEEEAATKIQAAFRGHKTRQSMKQPAAAAAPSQPSQPTQQGAADEPTREQLEQEFRLDDVELCQAATKIQASFRGHMTRKHESDAKKNEPSSCKDEKKADPEEELDIDLSDPDLNKAAVKIQASFRGHMVRKDNEGETATK